MFESKSGNYWWVRGPRDVNLAGATWVRLLPQEPSRYLILFRAVGGIEFGVGDRGALTTGIFTHPNQPGSANNSRIGWDNFGPLVTAEIWVRSPALTAATVTEVFLDGIKPPAVSESVRQLSRLENLVDVFAKRCDSERQEMFARGKVG